MYKFISPIPNFKRTDVTNLSNTLTLKLSNTIDLHYNTTFEVKNILYEKLYVPCYTQTNLALMKNILISIGGI